MPAGTPALGFASGVAVLDLFLRLFFTLAVVLVGTAAATAALVTLAGAPALLLLAPAPALAAAPALAPGMGA